MNLIVEFIRNHPRIKEIDLEYCELKDEDILNLFSQLTEKEIKSIYFRISRNENLTLKTAKLLIENNSYAPTIKCLADNANIYRNNSPEKEHIYYLRNKHSNKRINNYLNDSQDYIVSSDDDSEKFNTKIKEHHNNLKTKK